MAKLLLASYLTWNPLHFLVTTISLLGEGISHIGERSCCDHFLSLKQSFGLFSTHSATQFGKYLRASFHSAKTFLLCDVSLDLSSHCLIVGGEGAAVQNCRMRRPQRLPYLVSPDALDVMFVTD